MPTAKKPFAGSKSSVLTRLLADAELKLVDIGGRGEAFRGLLPLAAFARYYVAEPDRQEAERLRMELPREAPWRSVVVLTDAIASQGGTARLHVTEGPGMSSLLEPDPRIADRFCVAEKFRVVSVQTVPAIPLDQAASRYGFADAAFLKLDTQGTELDILRSGARLVREALLGVYTESLFQPFYGGQSLFADTDSYLRENGFTLFSLSRTTVRRAGYQPSLYSRRVVVWAHCLYFREPDTLTTRDPDVLRRQLVRLLGLAVAFQHYDLAFETAAAIRRQRLLDDDEAARLSDEVLALCQSVTRGLLRKAATAGPAGAAEAVTAPSYRDRNRVE